jgi:hypothetical protein
LVYTLSPLHFQLAFVQLLSLEQLDAGLRCAALAGAGSRAGGRGAGTGAPPVTEPPSISLFIEASEHVSQKVEKDIIGKS